ncbi:hypothetical protein FACS1894208_08860 [Clostridia bacterium]|nr:hypothetical protein FACS1894208_08860 [Clostridia bacterium]
MEIDFKKTQKELYQPQTSPSTVEVPEMTFIADPRKTALEKLKTVIRHPIKERL